MKIVWFLFLHQAHFGCSVYQYWLITFTTTIIAYDLNIYAFFLFKCIIFFFLLIYFSFFFSGASINIYCTNYLRGAVMCHFRQNVMWACIYIGNGAFYLEINYQIHFNHMKNCIFTFLFPWIFILNTFFLNYFASCVNHLIRK